MKSQIAFDARMRADPQEPEESDAPSWDEWLPVSLGPR
jgi:hypothetical protein